MKEVGVACGVCLEKGSSGPIDRIVKSREAIEAMAKEDKALECKHDGDEDNDAEDVNQLLGSSGQ